MVETRCFTINISNRQVCSLSPLFFNIILEVLANAVRQKKRITDIQIGKHNKTIYRWSDSLYRNSEVAKKPHTNKNNAPEANTWL